MRNKIIAVNAVIVLLVGLLSYFVVRSAVTTASGNREQLVASAKRSAQGAAAKIQLDGLRVQRWLEEKSREPGVNEPLTKASPSARGDSATSISDTILTAAKGVAAFDGRSPSFVAFLDKEGRVIGRNGSTIGRGDDLGSVYPALKKTLESGASGADLWIKRGSDLYLVAFASVMDESGKPGGGLVVGTTLNDLLSRASDATAGGGLVLASPGEKDGWNVVARSTAGAEALVEALKSPIGARLGQDISGGHVSAELANNLVITAVPLQGYVDGKGAALVAGAPAERIENAAALVTPILPILVLGLGLVVLGGIFLGNYIDRPIAMLEEGLLSIINGQADKRFELDHSELGGLAFRIDQLLNQLMGVEEDNSDEDGRLPSSSNQGDYAAGMQTGTGTVQGGANAGGHDGNDEYYGRLYSEYIEAKKGLGEQTSHITKEAFISRIQGMERDAAQKLGRSVRYQVKATGTEVTLVAVPV